MRRVEWIGHRRRRDRAMFGIERSVFVGAERVDARVARRHRRMRFERRMRIAVPHFSAGDSARDGREESSRASRTRRCATPIPARAGSVPTQGLFRDRYSFNFNLLVAIRRAKLLEEINEMPLMSGLSASR